MYNVWIVDDEPFILEGLAAVVDWPSLQLHLAGQAENGLDALEQIEESGAKVDILITDIAMPEMDGLKLIRTLKERSPELKSIVLSGYNEFDYIREGMRIGIENYLLKPINLEELTQTLQSTVEKLNRSRIESLNADQVDLLKDNILYRWVAGRISQEQWKLRSDFLKLRLREPYVSAAILRGQEQETPGPALQEARRLASAYMAEKGYPHLIFQDIDDRIVALIGVTEPTEKLKERLSASLEELAMRLGTILPSVPLIALGSTEENFERAPISYGNALLTLDYTLLYPREPLLVHERVTVCHKTKGAAWPDAEAYSRFLLAHDEEGIDRRIEEDFRALSAMEGVTPTELRDAAAEAIIRMKKLLKDANHAHAASPAYHDVMNRVLRSSTLEQLTGHVRFIAKEVAGALSGRQDKSPVIRQIVEYVHASYMEDFSLKTLAHAYRIHPVYLGQLFHKEMSQTFSDYVNRYRIEKAQQLMKTTPMRTQDVAKAVGYWDTAHFYKHFKKYVGVPPSQYRRMM